MKVVPPLEKWKKHKQSEREEFSDEKTSEDRSDVEDDTPLEIPKKKKRAKSPPKRKKRKLMKIPKINPRGIKRGPPPPPSRPKPAKRPRVLPSKVLDIPSKSLPKST